MQGKDIRIRVYAENMPEVLAQARELDQLAKDLRKKKYNVDFSINMTKPRQAIADFQKDFNTRVQQMQTRIVRLGSRMQTLGKAITNFTSPFTRIFTGALMGVGYSALNKVMSGLSGAFERYDIMNTYSKQLQAMGFEAEDAKNAIDKLRDSVIGLPTGLDEIVAAQKSYVGATNDVERATDLAIAANNAYIAGGTTSRQKKFIQNQLLALSSGADLTTSQWQSLQRNAPMALRAVSKELGYADDAYDQFLSDLKLGQIEGKKFLDAFIEVGTNGSIRNAANVMKTTWNALSENITNRTRDMGEKVLEALDTVFEGYNGRNLIQNLLGFDKNGNPMGDGIRDWIDGLTASMVDWIKQNPTKIIDFFDNLKKIDFRGILKGTFDELSWIAEKLVWLFDRIDGSSFAKYMIRGNILGRVITLLGGLGKGLATPLAVLGVGVGGGIGRGLGKLFRGLKDIFTGDKHGGWLFGGGGVAKGVGAAIGGWQGVANKALNIATIPVLVFSFKMLVEAFKEMSDVNVSWDRFTTNMKEMAVAIGAFAGIAAALGLISAIPGVKTVLLLGTGILTALSGGILMLSEAMQNLNTMVIPSPQVVEQKLRDIKAIVKPLQDMLDLFSEGGFFANIAKAAEYVSASWIISSIGTVVDAAKGVANKANELAELKIEEDLATKIGEVRTSFVPVAKGMELIIGAFDQGGVFANVHKILQNWSGSAIIDSIGGAATKVKNFYDTIKALGEDKYDQTIMDNASEWLGGFQRLVNSHYVTINAWNNKHMNKDLAAYVESMKLLGDAFGKLQTLLEHFDNITTEVDKYIRSGSFIGGGGDLFGNVRNRLGIITAFAEEVSGEDGALRKLQTLGGALDPTLIGKIATSIDELKGVFTALGELSEEIVKNPLFANNGDMGYGIGGLRHTIAGIIDPLNEVLYELHNIAAGYDLEGNIGSINNGLDKVSDMFSKLRTLAADVQSGIFTEIQIVKAAIDATSTLAQNIVNVRFVLNFIVDPGASVETTEGIIASYINAVLVYVDMFDATVTKKVSVTLTCEVLNFHNVVEKLRTDRNIIMDAIDNLNITRTRRVTVNLETRTNGGGEYYPHTGGLITDHGLLYRSKGGSIFKPRGTDIVPAMLTPGEYVMSRGAVDAFGARFMQRINNLDIPGAIRELSIRTGRKLSPASQIINNHTDNRSYSNVQHINTNNPNFAFRRSRWVSELR